MQKESRVAFVDQSNHGSKQKRGRYVERNDKTGCEQEVMQDLSLQKA